MRLSVEGRAAKLRRARDDASLKAARLAEVKAAVDDLLFGVAMSVAGREPSFENVLTPDLRSRVEDGLRSWRRGANPMRPDFGDFAEVRLEADLLDVTHPAKVLVDFDDRSLLVTDSGRLAPAPARHIRARLLVRLQPCLIEDCELTVIPSAQR